MGVSIRQTATVTNNSFNGWHFVFSSAPNQGNLLLFLLVHFSNNPPISAGFTQDINLNGVNNDVTSIYKYAGAGEPVDQQVTVTGTGQGLGIAWELQGVAGSYAADVRSASGAQDVVLAADAFTTPSFNTGANSVGILTHMHMTSALATTQTVAPTVIGGTANLTVDFSLINNGSVNRHCSATGTHDYFATSGTAVQYTVSTTDSPQQNGAYLIYEINNWGHTALPPSFQVVSFQ